MPAPLFGNFKQGDQAFISIYVVSEMLFGWLFRSRSCFLCRSSTLLATASSNAVLNPPSGKADHQSRHAGLSTHADSHQRSDHPRNEFEGHCLQTSTPRIRVTIPSNKIQADPWALASMVSILQLLWHVFAHQDPRVPRGCGALGIVSAAAHQSDSSLGNYNPPLRV